MRRCRFTGPDAAIFTGARNPDGTTLTADPGEVIDVPDGFEHPQLEPVTPPKTAAKRKADADGGTQ